MNSKHELTWGLDIGIGSCGWAVIDMHEQTIIDMGVRLWDVPQEPKTKTSLAATRRAARSARRNNKRTADRKKHCLELLIQEGLVPAGETAKWLQTQQGEAQTVLLRAEGLDSLLTNRQWAQTLYSICSRRGYIPHGETKDDTDAESKKVLSAIKANERQMEKHGYRTIGELLAKSTNSRNKQGDYSLCVSNKMLVEEIKLLFSRQEQLGSKHATKEFLDNYLQVLLWQKDASEYDEMVYNQVGPCSYKIFENEKRAAKATLSFELCRAYEQLTHIRIVHPDGSEEPLPSHIRESAIATLFSPVPLPKNKDCKVTYSNLRTQLDLPAAACFKGIQDDKEKTTKIAEPKAWAIIRKTIPKELTRKLLENRELADSVCEAVTYASSEKSLLNRLKTTCDLTDDEVKVILNLPYSSKVFNGYGSRCLKALNLLIDSFQDEPDIASLSAAEKACGLQDARLYGDKSLGSALPPYSIFNPTTKNPVVLRVMGQVRRVVNALYSEYGSPAAIRIELARELKQSEKERLTIHKRNRETADHRDALRMKIAEEMNIALELVKSGDIRKVEFHEMQGGICPYCGNAIHYDELIHSFTEDTRAFEVDHILPFSRTCDDGQNNKVLVHVKCNQNKGPRTPYEWITQEEQSWDEYVERVNQLVKLPRAKKQKLLNKDLSETAEASFINRNLNDTRYASREAASYIGNYLRFADEERQHIFAVSGGATAVLRNAWGIRKIREEDDLHHAIDAAVIAACTPSMVRQIARASEKKRLTPKSQREELFKQTQPWPEFSNELIAWKYKIIPTRKVNHGVTGKAFEDTVYAFCGMSEDGVYGILRAKGETSKSTNFVIRSDKSALRPDGIAFVRLWWDPSKPVRGRKEKLGKYLIEPVYYADLPAIRRGTYVPRTIPEQTDKRDRSRWDCVPADIMKTNPITLFRNDAISYKGKLFRFGTVAISTNSWVLLDPLCNTTQIKKGCPLSDIGPNDKLEIIQEDVLGHCFRPFLQKDS